MSNWYDDVCEYYNITPEEALRLGTRGTYREFTPGSITCDRLEGDAAQIDNVWAAKKRVTQEDIFSFYKECGSFSSLRQCVRHKDSSYLPIYDRTLRDGMTICEYGCGSAPILTELANSDIIKRYNGVTFVISDVDCEPFEFAKWRLKKAIQNNKLDIKLEPHPIEPNKLPKYRNRLDLVFCYEVMEHVPSPLKAVANLYIQMSSKAVYIENFVNHHDGYNHDGPDLLSAKKERSAYLSLLKSKFTLVYGDFGDGNRIWRRND